MLIELLRSGLSRPSLGLAGLASKPRAWSLEVKSLLGKPWCWPADPALAAAAEAACARPSPPAPGQVLVVTVSDKSACLWFTTPDDGAPAADSTDEAKRVREYASRLAAAVLPLLACADLLGHPPLAVRLLYTDSPTEQPNTFGGGSCGLSLCLAEASRLLDVPVPADLAASVALCEDATLAPVGHLACKVRLLSDVALGVRRLVVAASQQQEAQAAVTRPDLEVIGVSTLAEAFNLAFGDITEILRARWSADIEAATRSAAALYEMSLHNTQNLLDWQVVARSSALLCACLPEGSPARAEAALAEQIAIRHVGKATVIDWPDDAVLRSLRRVGRMWFVAHAVQSAADAGDEGVREAIVRAEGHLFPDRLDHGADELRVRGAIGRAQAALGDYAAAADTLWDTVVDWLAIRSPDGASHPLSELLRVLALLGRAERVAALEVGAVRMVLAHPGTADLSRAFLVLSLGRAHVLLSAHEEAVAVLDSPRVAWALTPDHLRFARVRWLVRALRGLGHVARAERERSGLLGVGKEQEQLAALDLALAVGEDWRSCVDALAWDVDVRRLFGRVSAGERGRYVAEHYRY